jgi:fatty-acyl-CoA synthase
MIISGGENIYPVEVENVLTLHSLIRDAAVIGVSDNHWGEVPLAILVLEEGEQPDDNELRTLCREHLASFKIPAYFHCVNEIPRNPSGKILKQQLRDEIGKNYDQ